MVGYIGSGAAPRASQNRVSETSGTTNFRAIGAVRHARPQADTGERSFLLSYFFAAFKNAFAAFANFVASAAASAATFVASAANFAALLDSSFA